MIVSLTWLAVIRTTKYVGPIKRAAFTIKLRSVVCKPLDGIT